jgi:hypothetical protein
LTELLCAEPQRTLDEFRAQDLIAWCEVYRKEVRRGTPYVFTEPWLDEIYTNQAKEKVIQKAAQVRISEYLISEALWRIDTARWSVFYAFPAFAKMSDFVKTRINPAILACPKLHEQLINDEIRVKTFGSASLFLSGAQDESQVTTASADMLIRDEFEFFPPPVLPVTEKRLGDSPHGVIRDASHCRFPGTGISKRYDLSDQRLWHITCDNAKCKLEQPLTWEQVKFSERTASLCDKKLPVPMGSIFIACKRCGEPLDRGKAGRWIPQNPDSGIAGWQVGKLMRPACDLQDMVRQSRLTVEHEIQAFYNYDLGLPYSPKGMRISESMLDALIKKDYDLPGGAKFSFAGIDVGTKLHVWIERYRNDGYKCPLFIGAVDDVEDVNKLLLRYGAKVAVMDAQPETRMAADWAKAMKGRAAVCYFQGPNVKKPAMMKFDDAKEDKNVAAAVTVHRTMICDENAADLENRRLILPSNAKSHPELYKHFKAMRRLKEKDKKGNVMVTWDSSGKADHLFFARIYALVARMLYREQGYGRGLSVSEDSIGSLEGTREFSKGGEW